MKRFLVALTLIPALYLTACDGLFDNDEEPTLGYMTYYVGDEMIQTLDIEPGTALEATIKCDRFVEFGLVSFEELDKLELVRDIDGEVTTCEMLRRDGSIKTSIPDWPARSTVYTMKAYAAGEVLEFGPFDITVEAVDDVVIGNEVRMADQASEAEGPGCFFQSRHQGWGGGFQDPTWPGYMAEGLPRVLDFAAVTEGGVLQAIAPDLIQTMTYTFESVANDCGFMSTTFEAYTGAHDPEMAHLTLEEINALPDPPAGATSIPLTEGLRFVYLTEEGKKGLVKIYNIETSAAGSSFQMYYSVAR